MIHIDSTGGRIGRIWWFNSDPRAAAGAAQRVAFIQLVTTGTLPELVRQGREVVG